MHVEGGLTGELIEAERGGNATIFRAQHNNCLVAVKTIRVTMNSDFDKCHSVSSWTFMYLKCCPTMRFVGILSGGCCLETSSTPKHTAVARSGLERASAFDDI